MAPPNEWPTTIMFLFLNPVSCRAPASSDEIRGRWTGSMEEVGVEGT